MADRQVRGSAPLHHRLRVGFHPADRYTMGRVRVRGGLWRGDPVERNGRISRLSAYLDVDFVNTWGYRFAAQGVTGTWALGLPLAGSSTWRR